MDYSPRRIIEISNENTKKSRYENHYKRTRTSRQNAAVYVEKLERIFLILSGGFLVAWLYRNCTDIVQLLLA